MTASIVTPRERLDQRPFSLGLFFPTMSGGWIMSQAAWQQRSSQWRWSYLSKLAQRAEQAGLDYLFMGMAYPVPGGFGAGPSSFRAFRMESLSTAAAVAAVTERIFVCPTVHILYHLHPIFLAQMSSTIDEISGGRFGMNLVAGFSTREAELLDVPARDHDERYQAASEFVTLMQRVWTEETAFDFEGRFYRSRDAWVSPRPLQKPYPLLVNAGVSEAGREFSARHCDWFFLGVPDAGVEGPGPSIAEDVLARARAYDRRLRLCTSVTVVCRETTGQAEDAYHWIVKSADQSAVENWRDQSQASVAAGLSQSGLFNEKQRHSDKRVFIGGTVVVGSPRQVAERLIELHRSGITGVHVVFLDFDELEFFASQVIPLLEEAGLR